MYQIKLIDFESQQIYDIAGKGIAFKKIRIPNENCTNFLIRYKIINQISKSEYSSPIDCFPSIYQSDPSQVTLSKSILIPNACEIYINLEPIAQNIYKGFSYIDYEVFSPTVNLQNKPSMKVFISESDRQNAFRIALVNLARYFEIPNCEYEDNQTLYNIIIKKAQGSPIIKLLQGYFKAYSEWFNFYQRIKKEIELNIDKERDLTESERVELAGLIQSRQNTLNALQNKFDELQFEKFQKLHGLDNINGIIL